MSFGVRTAVLYALQLAAALPSVPVPIEVRAFVTLCAMAFVSMIAAAAAGIWWRFISAVSAANACSMCTLYLWRRWDPVAAVGPVPVSLEWIALAVLGLVNVVLAAVVALAFHKDSRAFRFRWPVVGLIAASLIAFCLFASQWSPPGNSPQGLLNSVVVLEERADGNNWGERQHLSTILTILGRQREAREIPQTPNAVGHRFATEPSAPDSDPPFAVHPWREAIKEIAETHRLVLIMEGHTVTEHRAWIEQTLPLFREAGFTHYLVEAISESGSTLRSRGYAKTRTGIYTLDPRFGNLLRTAVRLGFEISGYDLMDPDFDRRENYQAETIARHFAARPDARLVVHAGHAHVIKHDVPGTGRYMAARLWEKTKVEPFTIWQWSNELGNGDYATLIRQIGPIRKPVLLMPPPDGLSDAPFDLPSQDPAVDAIVIHPPRLANEPTDRRGPFTKHLTRIQGTWTGRRRPVVIAAAPSGDPPDAIALDQIMLRPGETDFELWIPDADYEIRVWDLNGLIPTKIAATSSGISVDVSP